MAGISRNTLIYLLSMLLVGCMGGGHHAPVIERKEQVKVVPRSHSVRPGETLYSIAWRYNLEARRLASTNGIASPYTIYPGQTLALKVSQSKPVSSSKSSARSSAAATKSSARQSTTSPKRSTTGAPTTEPGLQGNSRYPFRWQWPVKGKMSRGYTASSSTHRGIDIQGKLGESVRAANSGKVVYAGSGLVGYGKLLIIKHDGQYLSAYGHNRRLLVKEGQLVRVGEKIAEVGDTGTDKVKLHFEIRRNGKPVNPLGLLPRG